MEITNLENDEAVLYGTIVDQAALHGLLTRVRDLGLPLVAVRSVGPTGEDLGDDLTQPALRLHVRIYAMDTERWREAGYLRCLMDTKGYGAAYPKRVFSSFIHKFDGGPPQPHCAARGHGFVNGGKRRVGEPFGTLDVGLYRTASHQQSCSGTDENRRHQSANVGTLCLHCRSSIHLLRYNNEAVS